MLLPITLLAGVFMFSLPGVISSCRDNVKHCGDWARKGECQRNPTFMNVQCKRSCKLCSNNRMSGCIDMNRKCVKWARIGECQRNPKYMNMYCKKSCGICTGCSSCGDFNRKCRSWAASGECKKNPAYMNLYCRLSCRLCTCTRTPPPTTKKPSTTKPKSVTTNFPSPPIPKTGDVSVPPIPTQVLPSPPLPWKPTTPQNGTSSNTTLAPPVPVTNATATSNTTLAPPVPVTNATATSNTTLAPPVPVSNGSISPNTTITTLPLPPASVCNETKNVGLAVGSIPNEAFKASTSESRWHQPDQGRLNCKPSDESVGCWCAGLQDENQYITVDLGVSKNITAILSQGRESEIPKYVTSYSVEYSTDGNNWVNIPDEKNPSNVKEFVGNSDKSTVKENHLRVFVLARHIRIKPIAWKNMICMRLEFAYCADGADFN